MLQKRTQTNLIRIGYENINQSPEFKKQKVLNCVVKHGVTSTNQLQSVKDKKKKTYLNHPKEFYEEIQDKRIATTLDIYGVENVFQADSIKQQISETINEKYGKDHIFQTDHFKEKSAQTDLEKYGCDRRADLKVIQKGKDTNFKKYGVTHPLKLQEFLDKREQTCLKKYKVKNVNLVPEIREKIEQTCLEKYGFINAIQSEYVQNKVQETRRKNGTFNTSKPEIDIFQILKSVYPDVKAQYKSDPRYPFHCDFYIPSADLFIELQAFWTHGKKIFDENDEECRQVLNKMEEKSLTDKIYKNAIYTWTGGDVKKRLIAKENKLNFLEIFDYNYDNILIQINRVINGLSLSFSQEELLREYQLFTIKDGNYQAMPNKNKIILNFQKHFFENEIELFKTDHIRRRKLIENRCFYLDKKESELTDADLLRGFKRSGIYRGFSHFSPLWIKAFIEEFNINSLYDPCGGWGHRLLGTKKIQYIYNDSDIRTYEGVKIIANFLKMDNKIFYNNDASQFTPIEDYEAVFTCPPYYNIEDYGNQFINYEEWQKWFDQLVKCSVKQNTKYFAFVINSNFEKDVQLICQQNNLRFLKQIFIQDHKSHFNKQTNSESLYIYNV